MKAYTLIFVLFIQIGSLYSQSNFFLSGKTDLVQNGLAVLLGNEPNTLYSLRTKSDTVKIFNGAFMFEGLIQYPEQHRILFLENNQITEPFFVDSGFQNIIINSLKQAHDILDFGIRVELTGSETNDEYFSKFLPLFDNLNKKATINFLELSRCDSISDIESKKSCIVGSDKVHKNLKLSRDSVLLDYAIFSPRSKIIPWLIRDGLTFRGYNDLFQACYDQVEEYTPENMRKYLDSFLVKEKSKAIGSLFPLADYINAHLSENYLQSNEYTLVDFWFAKCRPCIGQFNLLKDVYRKNKERGFDIVAISIDKQSQLQEYEKIIKNNDYSWKQILDTGGVQAKIIDIAKFPTNFLLDSTGKIIAIDIKPYVLDDFLQKELK